MTRILVAALLAFLTASLSAGGARAEQAWRKADCGVTNIVLPAGKSGQCFIGPIEHEQGCDYETYAEGAGVVPGPRFRVEVKVSRNVAPFCSIQPPNTMARFKSRAGFYVQHMAIAFSELQSLPDGSVLTLFETKDRSRDGDCFAFAKPEQRVGLAYRIMLTGFFCAGPGGEFDLARAQAVLKDVGSTF